MSQETARVVAAPGLTCPVEGIPQRFISDTEPVTVVLTAYYHSLLKDGSLLLKNEAAADPEPTPTE